MRLKELHLELNHFCNLACAMCEHPLASSAALSLSDLKAVLSSKTLMEAGTVSLTGGEPTLSKIFQPAAEAFYGAGKRLIILTNLHETGPLDLFLKGVELSRPPRVHVGSSVDGTPETHDSMRGRKGAWDKLLKNLLFLKKNRPVTLSLTFTVCRNNFREFEKVFDVFYLEHDIPVFPQYVIPSTPGAAAMAPNLKERREFAAILKKITAKTPAAVFLFSPLPGEAESAVCGAGREFLFVSPEGEIYACPQDKKLVLADLKDENIDKILEGRGKALARLDRMNCAGCLLKCRT